MCSCSMKQNYIQIWCQYIDINITWPDWQKSDTITYVFNISRNTNFEYSRCCSFLMPQCVHGYQIHWISRVRSLIVYVYYITILTSQLKLLDFRTLFSSSTNIMDSVYQGRTGQGVEVGGWGGLYHTLEQKVTHYVFINHFTAITAIWWFGLITSCGNDSAIFLDFRCVFYWLVYLSCKVYAPMGSFTGITGSLVD